MDVAPETLRLLPEQEALERHADTANLAVLWRCALVAASVSALAGLTFFALARPWPMTIALANTTAIALLYARSGSSWVSSKARLLCILFVLAQLALLSLPIWGIPAPWQVALSGVLFPLVVLAFRFRMTDYAFLLLPMWGLTVWAWLSRLDGLWSAPQGFGGLLWPTLATATVLSAASTVAGVRRREFVAQWRRETLLDRERERMREEIEDARQIQLSMLPRAIPQRRWLDVSGVSMPASEVGGDYFDYFPLGEDDLAVAIADVAGHGLASGLLLSGVRSCLYLLRRELASPAEVLHKLDDMVKFAAGRRMLVTLLCAHYDARARRMTLANAGHPPALLYRAAEGSIEEISIPALPLGTRLSKGFPTTQRDLSRADVIALYSDGLIETASSRSEEFGAQRLERAFRQAAAAGKPAREIRNAVLEELATFKGDARRIDDVTLVVVRVV